MDNKSRRSEEQKKMNRTIGTNIKFVRQCLGINQTKLANAIGPVRFQQVQKIEAAQNQINAYRLFKAAKYLKVPMHCLCDEQYIAKMKACYTPEELHKSHKKFDGFFDIDTVQQELVAELDALPVNPDEVFDKIKNQDWFKKAHAKH